MSETYYQTKKTLLIGTNYKQVLKNAKAVYDQLKRYTKRQPYIRSAYFSKKKVFLNIFWKHLYDKPYRIRVERLKYFVAAIDLIRYSRINPYTRENLHNISEVLHRFKGLTRDKKKFVVQLKQVKRSGKIYLMSIYGVKS